MKFSILWFLLMAVLVGGCRDGDSNTKSSDEGTDTDTANDTVTDTDTDTDSDSDTDSDIDSELPAFYPDVCGYEEEVTFSDVAGDGMMLVPPAHPFINYFGRVNCANPDAPIFGFPGVSIRARFTGTGIDMIMNDHGAGDKANYFSVVIDDGEPVRLEMSVGETTYELARKLSDGVHVVEVFKGNESAYGGGIAEFMGFRINESEELLELAPRPHRIEFIGDSITCGYGNELSLADPSGHSYTTENSNEYDAWGAIAARTLKAELSVVCISGRGVYRNYAGGSGTVMPDVYEMTLPEYAGDTPWDTTRFTPEVVVVNLGTNDFSGGIPDSEMSAARESYESAMGDFVGTLRGYYPDAAIVLAVGPMLSGDTYTYVIDALENIVDDRSTSGDVNVHFLQLPPQSAPYGEDWHPTVTTHTDMAEDLVSLITANSLM